LSTIFKELFKFNLIFTLKLVHNLLLLWDKQYHFFPSA